MTATRRLFDQALNVLLQRQISAPYASRQVGKLKSSTCSMVQALTQRLLRETEEFPIRQVSAITSALLAISSEDKSHKSIIFSCWRKTLDLIELSLNAHDINFVRMDGTVTIRDRKRVIEQFTNSTSIAVLLMTTGTGSVSINLPIADNIFIVEPQ